VADRPPFSVLLFGIDNNDVETPADPAAVEGALGALSTIVLDRLRASDLVWRSGQRIAAVLPDASRDQAAAGAEQIIARFMPGSAAASPMITASAGCAALDEEGDQPLATAEAALMMARRAGGSTVVQA